MRILLVISVFLPVVLFAQNASETVLNRMKDLPIDQSGLNFEYTGTDTVVGIEINYFHKRDDKCDAHLFFITDTCLDLIKEGVPAAYVKDKVKETVDEARDRAAVELEDEIK